MWFYVNQYKVMSSPKACICFMWLFTILFVMIGVILDFKAFSYPVYSLVIPFQIIISSYPTCFFSILLAVQ